MKETTVEFGKRTCCSQSTEEKNYGKTQYFLGMAWKKYSVNLNNLILFIWGIFYEARVLSASSLFTVKQKNKGHYLSEWIP